MIAKNLKLSISSVFLILIACQTIQSSSLNEGLELIQLIELSRHGARAPFYDLWDYRTNWNVPLTTLTNVGQRQHFLIGQELYRRYNSTIFNNGNYSPQNVSVLSTSSDRAQQSALSQLFGIFQQKGENMQQDWKFNPSTDLPPFQVADGKQILENLEGKNLPNSYVPINVLIPDDKRLLEPSDTCHGYDVLKAFNFNTDVYNQFDESLREFKQEFIELFGLQSTMTVEDVTIKVIANYWDSVICDIYQQIKLPSNFTNQFILKMNFVYDFQQLYLDFNSDSGDLLKMQTSTIFNDLISVVRDQKYKFRFYSASDGNVNAVLIAAGYSSYTTDFQEWLHPSNNKNHSNAPFASTVLFEIYQDKQTSKKFIKMIYNDKPIQIKGCSDIICDFENEFVSSMINEAILPQSKFETACALGFQTSLRHTNY
ncbi:histidine phosphatase family (branch 2) protein (macronuclear) [Tetrahymena thermophila SB210]|uniref:Histidine phosphatase family (Branch 2) protein n=1 Tax=Tetrahymena thermophila (strain SB210) TaxID=312017 RepID=A4VDK4_TETTS|nr:histidine phosphatase family (branch 2) protein [Tetrahymena thermophila SB210]EDK31611.2 histidine phosphatase family (branch 2) protein [Tetrahymena thermophila SB210]|eukprot:XP_001470860.2 histidine phosphatase family (branch 2) protein [Tetrahymena thermophila SB210]